MLNILLIIKETLNLIKLVSFKQFVRFLRKSGLFSFGMLFLMLFICLFVSFFIKNYSMSNIRYQLDDNFAKTTQLADNILKQCGDKVGISISTISIEQKEGQYYYEGRFKYVKACDKRIKNCLVDLINAKPELIKRVQRLDITSYNQLVEIGINDFPKSFNLRLNNLQSLDNLEINSVMKDVLIFAAEYWYKECILNMIYIDSLLEKDFKNKKVILYVLTFLTAKETIDCSEPRWLLKKIKDSLIL